MTKWWKTEIAMVSATQKPRNDSRPIAKGEAEFCHCEPERVSVQAWQSIFFLLKYEIATPAFGGLAMTEGLRLPRALRRRALASMGIGF
jgi:hypothetical protein